MTNFSSWRITVPLYNSSEVFMPAKQYGNTIHSPWILKRLFVTHYVPLFTTFWSHLQANSLFSMHNNWPLYLLKPYGSFILKLFLPLTFTVFVRIQNTFRKIKVVKVICIMFRDKWIILHLHEMVQFKKHQETSRKLKIYKGMVFETR